MIHIGLGDRFIICVTKTPPLTRLERDLMILVLTVRYMVVNSIA